MTYTSYQTLLHTKFHEKKLNHGSGSQFDPGPVNVTFVVDKVALGQVFLPVLLFHPIINIPPVPHLHLSVMLYSILATDSITAQFMKDQTALFGRLTCTDGYNAAIGLIVGIKQRKLEMRPILEYTRSVLCALLYMLTAAGVQLCDNVNQTLRQVVIFLVFVIECYTAG
jgi:hypothetical protein